MLEYSVWDSGGGPNPVTQRSVCGNNLQLTRFSRRVRFMIQHVFRVYVIILPPLITIKLVTRVFWRSYCFIYSTVPTGNGHTSTLYTFCNTRRVIRWITHKRVVQTGVRLLREKKWRQTKCYMKTDFHRRWNEWPTCVFSVTNRLENPARIKLRRTQSVEKKFRKCSQRVSKYLRGGQG